MFSRSTILRRAAWLASGALALALTACGGGNSSTAAGSASVQTDAAVTLVTAATWTPCAAENATCAAPAGAIVRYGANGTYASKSVTGPIACSNGVFGDPLPNVVKSCDYSTDSSATVPPPVVWTNCASEGGTCNVSGNQQVRYGANGAYIIKLASAPIACTNAVFGDPIPYTAKSCQYASAPVAPPVTWGVCASEGGTCTFSGTQPVRYGANGQYATLTATGSIACSNAVFGDPIAGVAKICQVATSALPTPPPPPTVVITDAIFAPTSFWYQPVPANAPLHPNSANFVTEFLRQRTTYYNAVNIGTSDYTSPVYMADAATPTARVAYGDCSHQGYTPYDLADQWSAVPIPAYAQQAGGTDGEMTVYQPSTNTLWEFWQASQTNGQWSACWGGRMLNVSTSNGIWPFPFGTTATGLPFLGGQITAEELQRGEIRHVIGMSLVDLEDAALLSWPANRSDGKNPNHVPNRIPQGTRFRLDPTINLDTLNLHPVGKIIAKAAQKYGFVVWDTAGMVSMRAENPRSYTLVGKPDPYVALFNGAQTTALFNNFPWDKLQFLPKDYGKP